ncbi:MAG: 16S rRNA (adenine(1518)-N(6)/adenine(1519)-N(6))-dimethyltransferase RsmA [Candidatus Neomarinimicrobiota bacterium]
MPDSYKHTFRKKWGQNFLRDMNLLNRIVETVKIKPGDNVLEIGPGEGILTEKIINRAAEMAAIEIDPWLIVHLQNRSELNKCHFLQQDILKSELFSLPISKPVRIIGNIPYNITSPILFWLIDQREDWVDAHIMVQQEMAQRLAAPVGTKIYGRLTVMTRAYMDINICFSIAPEVFVPRPKVFSAIIRLNKKSRPLISEKYFSRFEKIVKAAFSQRRKMLRNSLNGFGFYDTIQKEIDFTRRPETLSVEEFVHLAESSE